MYRPKPRTAALFGLLLALWGGLACGLSSDKDQPIELEADSADLDEGKGLSVYRGNVELRQGSMRLQADTVTVKFDEGQANQVIAEGRPVKFEQLPDDSKQLVKGRARRAEYLISSEELILIGDANLMQGKDSFKSDRIVYDRIKSKIKAGAAAEGKERVKITIGSQRNNGK
jgi:lipopolysaccharide export system protein LptA